MDFRKAHNSHLPQLISLMEMTRKKMIAQGINQWNETYPAVKDIENDVLAERGFILEENNKIYAYGALLKEDEPAYAQIDGAWLSVGHYLTIHRIMINPQFQRKKIGSLFFQNAENFAVKSGFASIRIDTNYDNEPMLRFLEKNGYKYCGKIIYQNKPKEAFEKLL